jgi:hypothetical protein
VTITYPLAFPTHTGLRGVRLRQRTVVAASYSPFTRQRQVQEFPGQWWEADITLPPMLRADAERWIAWLVSLNGVKGTWLMGHSDYAAPRGTAAALPGTPLVKGAGQTGTALLFDGAPTSQLGYLLAGDMIQLGSGSSSHLHKVLTDANSNASGEVTVDIWPRLRASPADNDPVTVTAAKGQFSLPPGAAADWSVNELRHYGIGFSAMEVV